MPNRQPYTVLFLSLLSLTSLILLPASSKAMSGRDDASCYRVKLDYPPSWISSAVWVESRSEILVVDPSRNSVLLYAPDGTLKKLPDFRIAQAKLPSVVVKTSSGFLLQMVGNSFMSLNRNLAALRERKIFDESKGVKGAVGSLYDWTMAGDDLVAYGSVRNPGADPKVNFRLGFFRTPLTSPSAIDFLMPYDDGDYYVLGFPYLTSLGSKAYFILMDPAGPAIYESSRPSSEVKKLEVFPSEYRNAPKLQSDMSGPSSAQGLFQEIEGLTIPVGLYGYKNSLYLLTRRPVENHTEWRLFKIDPAKGTLVGSVVLPTSEDARHLTIVPGGDNFFIFEKDHVGSYGQQKIPTMLVLPSKWITDLSAPPNATCSYLQK